MANCQVPRIDRWLTLSAAMVMMSCGGLTYTYAVYSDHLKQYLHFSQEQTDDVGAAKDFGALLGLPSGLFYNVFPPWLWVLVGAFLHIFGYSMIWLTLIGKAAPSFWLLCLYFAIGNGGDSWVDTACITTSLQNFEHHRGTAMGILKSQVGLSAAIYVTLYEVFLAPNVDYFILLVTLAPTAAYMVLAYFIKPFENYIDEADVSHRFKKTYVITVALGAYLMVLMIIKGYMPIVRSVQMMMAYLMIAILLTIYILPLSFKPLCFPKSLSSEKNPVLVDLDLVAEKTWHNSDEDLDGGEMQSLVSDMRIHEMETVNEESKRNTRQLTTWQCLMGIDVWLVVVVLATGGGTGIAIINNFSQIGKALHSNGANTYVGLISIWSCFGRLLSGIGSDYLLRRGYPRPVCLSMTQLCMTACCLLLSTGSVPCLYLGSALTGLSYGAYWTLTPTIVSEVFGSQQFAALYKIVSIVPTFASYLLSAKVLGLLYDKESVLYHKDSTRTTIPMECYGQRCFGLGLLWLAVACLLGMAASIVFFLRTKLIYKGMAQLH